MKILYYIHSLIIGGAEMIVANYLLELKHQGCEVALVVNERVDSFLQARIDENEIATHVLLKKRNCNFAGKLARSIELRMNSFRKEWARIVEIEKPDIIHIHTSPKLIRNIDFPIHRLVYTFHSDVTRALSLFRMRDINTLSWLAENGASFFCITQQACEDTVQALSTNNVVKIPNGVDLSAIRTNRYDREVFLPTLHIPTDAFIVGHVGRFHPIKNHEKLLTVFRQIVQKNKNAYLLLIGTGTDEEIAHVKALSEQYDVAQRTVFMGVREDAVSLMSLMDVLLLPSLSESFPLVLIEAQAQGTRCIASAAVPPDVMCCPNCIRLSLEESDDVWAEQALSYDERQTEKSLEDFDVHVVVRNMLGAYQKIITTGKDERIAE